MKTLVLRQIAPYVLLAVYLPMVFVSSLHKHHETIEIIDDCGHCSGHIDEHHQHHSDCLYCHFLSLNYLVKDFDCLEDNHFDEGPLFVSLDADLRQSRHRVTQVRAPPMV